MEPVRYATIKRDCLELSNDIKQRRYYQRLTGAKLTVGYLLTSDTRYWTHRQKNGIYLLVMDWGLRYKTLATQKRTWAAVSLCWALSCLLGFTPLFGWNNYSQSAPGFINTSTSPLAASPPPCTFLSVISLPFMVYFNFLGCVMAPLLVMTLLYTLIFWRIQGRLTESAPQAKASLLRERRLACSLALVLFMFVVCWIPLHLMNCLLLFQGPEAVTKEALYAGILLSHANSAVNPVIYAYRIPKIQQAYSQIWRRILGHVNCFHDKRDARRPRTGSQANHTERCGSRGRSAP